jgi:hypothetical protein
MTHPRYRTLLGATLAALFVGAAVAQTTSADPSRLPASKGTPQAQQTQPADAPTDKMKGQSDAQPAAADQAGKAPASEQSGNKMPASKHAAKKAPATAAKQAAAAKPAKHAKQASKASNQTTAALDPNEKAFRQALRQCAKEQQQSQRDSCLDTAIEQFQRG